MNDPRRPQRFGPLYPGTGRPDRRFPQSADRRPGLRRPVAVCIHVRRLRFRRGLQGGLPPRPPSGPQAPTRPVRPNSCRSTGNTTSPHRADFPRRADSPATARAENAALVVVRRRLSRAARRRVGHRTGYRQRLGQKQTAIEPLPPCPGLARHVRPRPHRPHPHPAPHRHRQLRPVRPVRRSPARCKPLSTTSRGRPGNQHHVHG